MTLNPTEAIPHPAATLPDADDAEPVHELVARHATAEPTAHAVAVTCGDTSLAYAELDTIAGRIAHRLRQAGVGRGSRVALLIEPSVTMVAAALGILRAGAAYVPIDRTHPEISIATVLADARVAAVVAGPTDLHRPSLDGRRVLLVDERADGPVAEPADVAPGDPAYLIYTSGSTGRPKGVLVAHRQLAGSTLARRRVYPGRPTFLLVSPLSFDSSVAGLWGTLTAGGRLVVATREQVRDPERMLELIRRQRITRLLCVPSLYRVLLDAADRFGHDRLASLDTVTVAGETLPEPLVARHFAAHPGVVLVNEYGPTETTVWASYHRMTEPGRVSIGRPVPGVSLYVLDEHGAPVPQGTTGELYIGGDLVSSGYFGQPEATAKSFLDNPFAPGRMYRTGDLARLAPDGTLDFAGRRDHQVKIRGHRIELGAVEAALRSMPGVQDAVALPDAGHTMLTGFVLAAADVEPGAVRDHVAQRLPEAMLPAAIRVLPTFPLTPNGKVDRAALAQRAALPAAPTPPAGTDGMIGQVAAAWADVLHTDTVPVDVNFFDLGGHSLSMFALQDALESHTGSRPSVVMLFRHTTVTEQAALIEHGGADPDESAGRLRAAAARRAEAMRARRERVERRSVR